MNQSLRTLRDDVAGVFSPARFAVARLPVRAGYLRDPGSLDELPSCLDMPIMLPGGPITLPQPYIWSRGVISLIEQAIGMEDALLPGWRATRHLYLTVDTRWVEPGRTHRNGGFHFDGMQGARYPRKLPACHQYVASTAMPTEFSDLPVDAGGLDESLHNWFEALGGQVPDDHALWTPDPCEIVCMSAYQLHRSPVAKERRRRTFIRLDVSVKHQDRLGNTPNPELVVPWRYVERALPAGLGRPVSDSTWDGAMRLAA